MADILTQRALVSVAARALEDLQSLHYEICETDDHRYAVQSIMALDKGYLTPTMSPEVNDFTSDNCIWFLLRHGGKVVGGAAARRDRLGKGSLGQFLEQTMARQYGAPTTTKCVSSVLLNDVRGTVAYFGDLIVAKSHQGFGDHLRLFGTYCQYMTALAWNCDWHYVLMSYKKAEANGALFYGFSRIYPGVQIWENAPHPRASTECCAIANRNEIIDMAQFYYSNPNLLGDFRAARRGSEQKSDAALDQAAPHAQAS